MVICIFTIISTLKLERPQQQFLYQAENFLVGRIDFDTTKYSDLDTAYSATNNEYYWPLGIFPSIIMLPVALLNKYFGTSLLQNHVTLIIALLQTLAFYLLLDKFSHSKLQRLALALLLNLASNLCLGLLVPDSWYFAHNIAFMLASFSLYFFHQRQNYAVTGILLALIILTRLTAGLIIIYFIAHLIINTPKSPKLNKLLALTFPVALVVCWQAYFNFVRFGNPFETGYALANVHNSGLVDVRNRYGLFNPIYIPFNLVLYFFMPPAVETINNIPTLTFNWNGLSIFITTPILLISFLRNKLTRSEILQLICFAIITLILSAHYTAGFMTYGPRYLLDALPLLLPLIFGTIVKLKPQHHKYMFALLIISAFVNVLLLNTKFPILQWLP